jgi:HEAT repeat protein
VSVSRSDPVFSRVTAGEILKLRYARDVAGLLGMLRTSEVADSAKLRREIVFALYKVGDSAAAPELRRLATTDSDERVRLRAVGALRALGDRQSVDVFKQALSERNSNTRLYAVEGLERTGLPEAVPVLVTALQDRSGTVRTAAARALANLGDPAALAPLRQAIHTTWRPLVKAQLWLALRDFEQRISRH